MVCLSAFLVILFSTSVLSDGGSLLIACEVNDTECLSKTTQQFLEKTSIGIPEYDIKPIDPLFVPSIDIQLDDKSEIVLHYKNVTITGLQNQQFSDFKLSTKDKSVVLQTRASLTVDGDITIVINKIAKSFHGAYTIKGNALGTAKYSYKFKVDEKGVEHFEVGPETITCQAENEPEVTLSPELRQALEDDKDLKEKKQRYSSKRKEIQQNIFCKIVEKAYVTVVHNIRAAAKILPKNSFLKGV